MELPCPLGTTRRVPQEKFPRKPYNKSFIDQAFSVKMTEYWPRSFFFFCMFMDVDSVSVHKHAKKELGQYPAILTSHLVNNPYLLLTQQARSVFFTITLKVGVALRVSNGSFCSQRSKTKETDHFCIQRSEKYSRKMIAVLWLEIRQPKVKKWLS